MYLPLAGFTGVLVLAVYAGSRKLFDWLKLNNPDDYQWAPVLAAVALPVIVGVYGVRAYDRNFAWKSDYTLWKDAIATNPLSFRSHQSYAFAIFERYMEDLRLGRSVQELEPMLDEMITVDESARDIVDPLPNHLNSSRLYMHLGMYYTRKAETHSSIGPNGARVHTPESIAWLKKATNALEYGIGVDRAFSEVNRARALRRGDKPRDVYDAGLPTIYNLAGNAYAEMGDYDTAYRRYVYARHLDPKDPDAYIAIARLKAKLGRLDEATQSVLEALLVVPNRQEAWEMLVALYNARGPGAQNAILQTEKGLQVNLSGNQMVQEDMLTAYRDLIRVMRRALRWDFASFYRNQALTLYKYPTAAIDPVFNEPIEIVTPDGIQFNQLFKLE
jgi:tetratricopeptide (TPR) repeat protein